MTLAHETSVRNELADLVVDHCDDGTGVGKIRIYTAAFASLLVDVALNDPAFGTASAGVAAGDVTPNPKGTAVATGTAAKFRLTDSDDTVILDGDVATSGSDLNLSSLSISSGDAVQINTMSYTAPA